MHLPPEIVQQIVDQAAPWAWITAHIELDRDTRRNLKALSLVSKAWRGPAPRLLFAARRFRLPQNLEAFTQRWSPLRCISLRLEIDTYTCDQPRQQRDRQFQTVLLHHQHFSQRMQHVQCLEFFSEDHRLYRDVELLLQSAARLRVFKYDHVPTILADSDRWDPRRHSMFAHIHNLLPILSDRLQHLSLNRVLLNATPNPLLAGQVGVHFNLTSLVLETCVFDDADLLNLVNSQTQLRTLVVEDLAGPSVHAFSQALTSIGGQLYTLCLIFPGAGSQSDALHYGYVHSEDCIMSSYRVAVPSIMRACVNLRELELRRAGIQATDLSPLASLTHLSVDLPEGPSDPSGSISVPGIRNGTWLPQLQALIVVPPDFQPFEELDHTYISLNCQRRGIRYTEDVVGLERLGSFQFKHSLPDPRSLLAEAGL